MELSERLFTTALLGVLLLVGYGHVEPRIDAGLDRFSNCVDRIGPDTTNFCG